MGESEGFPRGACTCSFDATQRLAVGDRVLLLKVGPTGHCSKHARFKKSAALFKILKDISIKDIMDTGSILYEVEGIDKELARLRKEVRELNNRKKDLLTQAVNNMKDSGDTQISHRGKTYILEERSRHARKNDKKKREDTLTILNDEGFHGNEADEVYVKLTDALRGPETFIYTLKQ